MSDAKDMLLQDALDTAIEGELKIIKMKRVIAIQSIALIAVAILLFIR